MNVIFIAIDTLRSDHLSCYGYPKRTSPNIDAIAERGALVETFYSVGNCTHPGFTAMFSGMFPETTGIVGHWTLVDPPEATPMMAERFAAAGRRTCAIDNLYDGWARTSRHRKYPWFRRAYEHYDYPQGPGFYQHSHECVALACDWLEQQARDPFLLFLHVWNPHAPYNKAPEEFYGFYDGDDPCDPRLDRMPPSIRASQQNVFGKPITDPAYVVAAYDAEIAYTDHSLGALFETVDRLKLTDDTLIVITSDHGEIMDVPRIAAGRPWCFSHINLHEDNLRLPFIIAGGPVAEGRRVRERFQLVDIMPTLVELCDLAPDDAFDGMSMAPALTGQAQPGRDAVFFSENTYQKQRAVMKWPWKYIRCELDWDAMPRRCLFNLEHDPGEHINVADMLPRDAQDMDELCVEYAARVARGGPDPLLEQDITHSFPPPEGWTKY